MNFIIKIIAFFAVYISSNFVAGTAAYACNPNSPYCPIAGGDSSSTVDPRRKVRKLEYDNRGNRIKVQVFDDVRADAELISQSESQFDQYNNVILERKIATPYDASRRYSFRSTLAQADGDNRYMLEQRYAYDDTSWPTKPTAIYQPRYASLSLEQQEPYAQRFFYDGQTGALELQYSSDKYCTNLNADYNSRPKAGTFSVEQSGSPQTIEILPYVRCDASAATEFDEFGRPTKTMKSQALLYAGHANPAAVDRVWNEMDLEYYPLNSVQKSALRTSTFLGEGGQSRTTTFDWDRVGNLTSVIDNAGAEMTANYDSLRRLEYAADAIGGEIHYAYDPVGRLRAISKKISSGKWAISEAEYYADGKLLSVTDPDGDVMTYSYDIVGRADIVTDEVGRQSKSIYYPNGQVKCTIQGYGTELVQAYVMYDYGPDGQVQSQRPAKGVYLIGGQTPTDCEIATADYDTDFVYDEYRRLFETTFAKRDQDVGADYVHTTGPWLDRTYSRQWLNASGQTYQSRTRAGGLAQHYIDVTGNEFLRRTPHAQYYSVNYGAGHQYSSEIRPRDWTQPDTAHVDTKYPKSRRQNTFLHLNAFGEILSEYTQEGFQATISAQFPTTTPSYDNVGNLETLKYFSGAKAVYDHDSIGQMTSAQFSADGSVSAQRDVASIDYDLLGRMTRDYRSERYTESPEGTRKTSAQLYSFDADDDLKAISHRWVISGNPGLVGFSYKFDQDASGKITKKWSSNAGWREAPGDRDEDYGSVNKLDQYETVDLGDGADAQAFDYDANGNLTSDGQGRTYSYNSESQLIKAVGTAAGDVFDMEYRYDALGRRSYSIDYENNTEVFHKHFGQMEVEDLEVERQGGVIGQGKILNYNAKFRNILGTGVDSRLAYHDVDGDDLTFPLTDHQGSTVIMTDEDGKILDYNNGGRRIYGPYGQTLKGDTATGYPYRYTGRRYDAQTGLYYYRARYYDPRIGRFLQTDPIGTDDQMNLYAYVGNDPLNATDPSGMVGVNLDPFNKRRKASDAEVIGAAGFVADFTPFVGSFKGFYEFVQDPSLFNAIGIIPYGKIIKRGKQGKDALGELADELADNGHTGAVSELILEDGSVFRAASGGTPNDEVTGLLIERARKGNEHSFRGGCSEVGCISAALDEGNALSDLDGATMRTLQVGKTKSAIPHGEPKPACSPSGCQDLLSDLGISEIK